MKWFGRQIQPLLLAVIATALVMSAPAWAVETSHKINAKGAGQINFATNSSDGVIEGGGLLHGTTHGEFAFTSFDLDTGIGTFEGTFTITNKHGTLTLFVFDGVFDTTTGEFSNDSVVIDGRGRFDDATGGLFFGGVVFPDGSYLDDITGDISLDLP